MQQPTLVDTRCQDFTYRFGRLTCRSDENEDSGAAYIQASFQSSFKGSIILASVSPERLGGIHTPAYFRNGGDFFQNREIS